MSDHDFAFFYFEGGPVSDVNLQQETSTNGDTFSIHHATILITSLLGLTILTVIVIVFYRILIITKRVGVVEFMAFTDPRLLVLYCIILKFYN